jgi:hypothetical protein
LNTANQQAGGHLDGMKVVLGIPAFKKFVTYAGRKASIFAAVGWLPEFNLWLSLLLFTGATGQAN